MLHNPLSRRSLFTLAGVGAAALFNACEDVTAPPAHSPFNFGRYRTAELILGETSGTQALPQMLSRGDIPIAVENYNVTCADGRATPAGLPGQIKAAVYYPQHPENVRDHRVPEPNPLKMPLGPFPVVLYAHGVRIPQVACQHGWPSHTDFTRLHEILKHMVSYGCVAVAPDLDWLPGDLPGQVSIEQAFELRARVLEAYYGYLSNLNSKHFAGQLDLGRVILVGHSTGAGACAVAGSRMSTVVGYGFLGPYFAHMNPPPTVSRNLRGLMVVHGTEDSISGDDAMNSYRAAGLSKTIATIPGANHFGYTHLCELDNTCDASVGTAGTISRAGQQKAAGAYMASLLRYYALGDATVRTYLTGLNAVEGLGIYGVRNIAVQSDGFDVLAPPN